MFIMSGRFPIASDKSSLQNIHILDVGIDEFHSGLILIMTPLDLAFVDPCDFPDFCIFIFIEWQMIHLHQA